MWRRYRGSFWWIPDPDSLRQDSYLSHCDEKSANAEVYRLVNKLKEFMCDGFYFLCEAGEVC